MSVTDPTTVLEEAWGKFAEIVTQKSLLDTEVTV